MRRYIRYALYGFVFGVLIFLFGTFLGGLLPLQLGHLMAPVYIHPIAILQKKIITWPLCEGWGCVPYLAFLNGVIFALLASLIFFVKNKIYHR